MKGRALASTLALVVFLGGAARAETPPAAWDRVQDPGAGERYRLHLHVMELLHPPLPGHGAGDGNNAKLLEILCERARAELEQASAGTSNDPLLRLDLGEVYDELRRWDEAIAVLKPATTMASGGAETAIWGTLASAYAHLDRSREERDAYDHILSVALDDHIRLNAMLNRAEAEMRLGNLDEAVAGYRDVVTEVQEHGTTSLSVWKIALLARWGLAVALDRNGDPSGAEHEALIASEMDPTEECLTAKNVFFVPAYELDWYLALGRAERAKREPDPRLALELWTRVVAHWQHYVASAVSGDRWAPLAAVHLTTSERSRASVEVRVRAMAPPLPWERIINFPTAPPRAPTRPHP